MSAILELLADSPAHLKLQRRRYGHIAGIEEAVKVAAQEQAVARRQRLVTGEVESLKQLAQEERVDASDIGRTLHLAFLSPLVVDAILSPTNRGKCQKQALGT